MKLTEEQKEKVGAYLFRKAKFRETYNELYDHVLNSLENNDKRFGFSEIDKVINNDFGGYKEIVRQEDNHRNYLYKKYARLLPNEMLNTFRMPGLIGNVIILILCSIIYLSAKETSFNLKPLLFGSIIGSGVVVVYSVIIVFAKRLKCRKFSILDSYLLFESTLGLSIYNFFFFIFLSNESPFQIKIDNIRLMITLVLFFFTSVYVRSFIKFYNQKIKVLVN